jgi:putative hydrolase of the HAD superfamily
LLRINAIFWDVGGVLLTNGWDRAQREKALEQFHLDREEFNDRHEMLVSSFERGKISLDEYLDRTIFYRSRPFTRDEFRQFMFALSQPKSDDLALAQELSRSGKYLMTLLSGETPIVSVQVS